MSRRHREVRNWRWIRQGALVRANYACQKCGSRAHLEVDHKVPLEKGGDHSKNNLQVLCAVCHKAKTQAENRMHPVAGQDDWSEGLLKDRRVRHYDALRRETSAVRGY